MNLLTKLSLFTLCLLFSHSYAAEDQKAFEQSMKRSWRRESNAHVCIASFSALAFGFGAAYLSLYNDDQNSNNFADMKVIGGGGALIAMAVGAFLRHSQLSERINDLDYRRKIRMLDALSENAQKDADSKS